MKSKFVVQYDVVYSKFVEYSGAVRLIKEIPVLVTIHEGVEYLRTYIKEQDGTAKTRAARFIH